MKKYLIIIIFLLIFITSCKKNSVTIINNVYNNEIDVEDNIKIESLDDMLNAASQIATSSSIGLRCNHKSSILSNTGYGSAVIYKREGNIYYALTCRHVITNQTNVLCDDIDVYINGVYIDAAVGKYDKKVDLATVTFISELDLPLIKIADSISDMLARYVISVGSPYDMEAYYNSVTVGNISGLNRKLIEKDMNNKDVENIYTQHTATLNIGMSGGGLFNLKGELIGINDYKISNNSKNIEGMNFAVALEDIIEFIK